jgi:glycosyltransferase 2 family protein
VTGASGGQSAEAGPKPAAHRGPADRRRAVAGFALGFLVLGAAGFAIYRQRHTFVLTLKDVGVGPAIGSFILGLIGVGVTYPIWWNVLDGLGVKLPYGAGARVFFTSQLGKYVPGSVWPILMQMEAGRARGASRRTMLGANLISIVLSSFVGLLVACLLLPLYDLRIVGQYWWVLLGLPFLLALLHPRALPGLLDRAFVLLRRPALDERLSVRSEVRAVGWGLVCWTAMGAQLGLLAGTVSHIDVSVFVLCTGAVALAIPLGVLFVPAPAGAGIRDVVLIVVLSSTMSRSQALAIVLAARVILIICDVTLAGLAMILGRMRRWVS